MTAGRFARPVCISESWTPKRDERWGKEREGEKESARKTQAGQSQKREDGGESRAARQPKNNVPTPAMLRHTRVTKARPGRGKLSGDAAEGE